MGQICCGTLGGANFYTDVSCQQTCNGVVMCAGDPTVCDVNQTCNPSMTLGTPYAFCL
jgi:hypothetical protein